MYTCTEMNSAAHADKIVPKHEEVITTIVSIATIYERALFDNMNVNKARNRVSQDRERATSSFTEVPSLTPF